MRWPVLLIGGVLLAAVVVFSAAYEKSARMAAETATDTQAWPDIVFSSSSIPVDLPQSGVRGSLQVKCPENSRDEFCRQSVHTIEAYEGISSVALFKTDAKGAFQAMLSPGKYELRVDASSSTKCGSVGVVVPEKGYSFASITCTSSE